MRSYAYAAKPVVIAFGARGEVEEIWHDLPMAKTPKRRRLVDAYAFAGFRPAATVRGRFGDPQTRIIFLTRRTKKRTAASAERCITASTTAHGGRYGTCRAAICGSTSIWRCAGSTAGDVPR